MNKAQKARWEEVREAKMTDRPPLQGDKEIAEWMEKNHCSGFVTEYAREAQRDADRKWFAQWLEEREVGVKAKCPDCAWNLFQSAESIRMFPCYHCNSTGYLTKPLRLEEKCQH